MKKVLIVLLVLLLLAGIGGGGYFLWTNFLSDMVSGSDNSGADTSSPYVYAISSDSRFSDVLKSIKKEVGKKEYESVIASLDATVSDVVSEVPEYDRQTFIQQISMVDMYSVTLNDLDMVYGYSEPQVALSTYVDLYYELNMDVFNVLDVIFGSEEEETEPTSESFGNAMRVTVFDPHSGKTPATEIFNIEMINNIGYMLNSGWNLEYKPFNEMVEKFFNDAGEGKEEKVDAIISYVDNIKAGLNQEVVTELGSYINNDRIYYAVEYNGQKLGIFDIDLNGDLNDSSSILDFLINQAPADWAEYDYGFNADDAAGLKYYEPYTEAVEESGKYESGENESEQVINEGSGGESETEAEGSSVDESEVIASDASDF